MGYYPSLAPYIRARPWLFKLVKPLVSWYANASGYRQLGLRRKRPWIGLGLFLRRGICMLRNMSIALAAFQPMRSQGICIANERFVFAVNSADDLIIEENETVLKALSRLPPKEAYDRVYRLRRAVQCSVTHKLLPKDQWTKPEEDIRYLSPILEQIALEEKEKAALDTLTIVKKH
ncbi:cytochrome b-c1 complex subunit 7 [Astrocystis sublimbata]|nr:cytochrome b-c1 complex subunit 7 [Astrocystis sublimbata]